jgi:hypothetical protein
VVFLVYPAHSGGVLVLFPRAIAARPSDGALFSVLVGFVFFDGAYFVEIVRVGHRVVLMEHRVIIEDTARQVFFDAPSSDRARTFIAQILPH